MKRIIYSLSLATVMLATSCTDFLDTKNLYEKDLDSFYSKPVDIQEAMGGVYNALYVDGIHSDEHLAANLLSDLMMAGGGPDDATAKNADSFTDPNEDTYKDLFVETYNGVYRCNAIIESLVDADFSAFYETDAEATDFINNNLGEAYFMRAFHYFRAAKFFGGLPLINETSAPRDAARATIPETYGQIASDLKKAIELMRSTEAGSIDISQYGHANKWTAEAYMARVYLYFTGYMTNIEGTSTTEITLPEGTTIGKAEVVAYLTDVIDNSGYALASDFRNLWPYSYANESAGETVLPWAETEGLAWVGQDGPHSTIGTGNDEVMFAQRYAYGNWDWAKGQSYNNRVCLYFGIRDNSMIPFGQGWGWGTVHPLLVSEWDDADVRKEGSILEMGNADQGTDSYQANKGDHESGYFNKKYTTIQHANPDPESADVKGMFYWLYDMEHGDPMQLWAAQDFFYLRFSDVLLMQSELTEDASYMNLVRNRAGLDDISYSLEAVKEERKHEFAFEGLRWFDLVRWGDVEDGSMNYYDNEVDVNSSGVATKYSVNYRSEIKGLVPLPESEIRLSEGVYEQNPGW